MKEPVFKSKLSIEEIESNFKDTDFFEGLSAGLKEALAYEKGNAKAETIVRKRNLPEIDMKAERDSLNMTQKAFAAVLGVSTRTVEAWEAGRSTPSPTAKNLMYLISQDHELVDVLMEAQRGYGPGKTPDRKPEVDEG